MANVELRPGDTLNIVWSSVQDTPLGLREVESNFAFTYDELLAKLRSKGRAGKSRRSGTDGARFSRVVALATNAMRKGKWSTGADIDRDEVFDRMMNRFKDLKDHEFTNITGNARDSLIELFESKMLKPQQKKELREILDKAAIKVD
jgi:hypothetical protein